MFILQQTEEEVQTVILFNLLLVNVTYKIKCVLNSLYSSPDIFIDI